MDIVINMVAYCSRSRLVESNMQDVPWRLRKSFLQLDEKAVKLLTNLFEKQTEYTWFSGPPIEIIDCAKLLILLLK